MQCTATAFRGTQDGMLYHTAAHFRVIVFCTSNVYLLLAWKEFVLPFPSWAYFNLENFPVCCAPTFCCSRQGNRHQLQTTFWYLTCTGEQHWQNQASWYRMPLVCASTEPPPVLHPMVGETCYMSRQPRIVLRSPATLG